MLDSSLDRFYAFRLGAVSDCWGTRRSVRTGARNGIWFIDAAPFDEPPTTGEPEDPAPQRERAFVRLSESGRLTTVELQTLRALVVDRATIAEIAERDGCSRQAVIARLTGNSRGQGGIVKKARAILATSTRRSE